MGSAIEYIRWAWIFLALLFFLAELFTPRVLFAYFGIGAVAAAVAAFLNLGFLWQVGLFVLVGGAGVLLSLLTARRAKPPAETVYGVDRVIGKEAIVIVAIDPKTAQGRVRVEREQWPADSESGQPIADGATVQVLAVRGARVLVRPLPNTR